MNLEFHKKYSETAIVRQIGRVSGELNNASLLQVFDLMMSIIRKQWDIQRFDLFSYTTKGDGEGFGEPCAVNFARRLVEMDPTGAFRFELQLGDGENHLKGSCTSLTNPGLKFVTLSAPSLKSGRSAATEFILEMFEIGGVVSGYLDNLDYTLWQVSSDPRFYPLKYGTIDGFALVRRKVGPLGFVERIDTSRNPGRSQVIEGACLHVAAEMWFGTDFWNYTACSKEELLSSRWVLEALESVNFTYVRTWPSLFVRPDGDEGKVQAGLWRLLFAEQCEWPPGSGGISDNPVGGPPELMPPTT